MTNDRLDQDARANNPRFRVQIDGEYGAADGSIHLLVDGEEVVMWDSAEWAEDPSLVFVIADCIRSGVSDPDILLAMRGLAPAVITSTTTQA